LSEEWISLPALTTQAWQENLSYLSCHDHELLKILERAPASETLLFQEQDGLIRCRTAATPPQWIFGKTSPREELEWLKSALTQIPGDTSPVILLGTAASYALGLLRASILETPQRRVLAIEPTAARIQGALALLDIRALLETGRLYFAVRQPTVEEILAAVAEFNLWGSSPPALVNTLDIQLPFSLESFFPKYLNAARVHEKTRALTLTHLRKVTAKRAQPVIRRVLLLDCWPGTPQSLHTHSVQRALEERSVQIRTVCLDRRQIDRFGAEYRRRVEPELLAILDSFQPQLAIVYAHHAPQILGEELYSALGIPFLQVVTNLAYYDRAYFPGEHTALIEQNLIPYFRERGAPHPFFLPIMADYALPPPPPSRPRFPIVFIGNYLGLPTEEREQFFRRWSDRDVLIQYLQKAERELSVFENHLDLFTYLDTHPVPQISTIEEKYAVFRFLLCEATAARRCYLLEKISHLGPAIFGYWENKIPAHSPLRQNLRGPISIHDEPQVVSQGGLFVNIHSVGHVTCPNMRFFNMPGLGGFQLSDGDFADYLEPDTETVYYRTGDEWVERVTYYLHHPEEADEIRRRGNERIRRDWTYAKWVEMAFAEMKLSLP